jgi:ABC-type transporter Mla subunit MlaD
MLASVTGGIAQADGQMASLHSAGMERTQALAASISALDSSTAAMTETLRIGDETAGHVITTAENLLVALDASAREIDETMPEALTRLEDRIGATRHVIATAKPELLALVTAAESTHDAIEAIADVVTRQRETLVKTQQALIETLDSGHAKTDQLEEIVDRAVANAKRFAEDSAPQLVEALLRIRETARAAADHARETLAGLVPEATRQLEEAGSSAMRRAIDAGVRQQLVELGEVAEASVTAAARASERLTQQMLTIGEASSAVERRIEEARAEREAADQDNFARRVSLLVEALNSASIDITKAFSHEVTDSAWAAYLKGDRGVFTRRAVRLLDNSDAREIASLHENDPQFREQVNRYIHDFEAMLRQVLALRDGSPLGVTLLSSDMGKLYVALAQAIERLRA